jgi:hypothetical protein
MQSHIVKIKIKEFSPGFRVLETTLVLIEDLGIDDLESLQNFSSTNDAFTDKIVSVVIFDVSVILGDCWSTTCRYAFGTWADDAVAQEEARKSMIQRESLKRLLENGDE